MGDEHISFVHEQPQGIFSNDEINEDISGFHSDLLVTGNSEVSDAISTDEVCTHVSLLY